MNGKRQVFAIMALIAIAITTIAWAQLTLGTDTIYVNQSKVTSITAPSIDTIDKGKAETVTEYKGLKIGINHTYVEVRVALVDLGGLYENMKTFTISFKNNTSDTIYTILTLDEPTATFVINSTGLAKYTLEADIVASYKAKAIPTKTSINYGVAAEVIAAYGPPLS
jgi:hypothetical protein